MKPQLGCGRGVARGRRPPLPLLGLDTELPALSREPPLQRRVYPGEARPALPEEPFPRWKLSERLCAGKEMALEVNET